MKKKVFILGGATLFILLILAVLTLFENWKNHPTSPSIDTNGPTGTLTQTPTSQIPSLLSIVSSLPPQNPPTPYLPFQKITLIFSKNIRPEALRYEISPFVNVDIKQGENEKTLLIVPKSTWEPGRTILTILSSTLSTDGSSLLTPFVYTLLTGIQESPELKYLNQ